MVDKERINDFIMSISHSADEDLMKLKKYAIESDVPIIKDETKDFLDIIIRLKKPKYILELGTAIAYSTLCMYKVGEDFIKEIVTIEKYAPRIKEAKENIDKYFKKDIVKLIEGDIDDYLAESKDDDRFDLIFLDAAKAQYVKWLPALKKILKSGGVLISDNTFKDGEVLQSKYLIDKRDRTIHKRMREFLYNILHDDDLLTKIFNIGDGVSISIKK